MRKSKCVSVIVPVYNVPKKYLKRCINSLTNQTLKDIEIILVDDGTPSTSGKICDKFAQEDSRIIVIHQKNKGLCGARNAGVKKAKGKWISFVDGDDWIDQNTYEVLYNEGELNNVDVVMFGYIKEYPSKSIVMNYKKYFKDKKIYKNPEDIRYLQRQILNYDANCAMAPTKFIKRSLIEKNNIYHDEKLRQGAEGIEFNIRLFSIIESAEFVDKNFYHYIYNSESITTVHNEENHKMVLECFKQIKNEVNLNEKELKKMFYSRVKHAILTTAISGYFSSSNKVNYFHQKKGFKKYLKDDLVIETLNEKKDYGLSKLRIITLWMIRMRLFLFVKLVSIIRTRQKSK